MSKKIISFILLVCILIVNISPCFSIEASGESAILVDPISNIPLYEKNADAKAFPASTTKIMTALLVLEKTSLSDKVTVSKTAVDAAPSGSSTAYLMPGEILTVDDLLVCLLVQSANEAANVLAEHVSGNIETFVGLMNKKAAELGCTNTHFVNPHGFHDENHYTTARDLYKITKEAIKHKRFLEIVNMSKGQIPATNLYGNRVYYNTNLLISPFKSRAYIYKYATGIKTGYTSEAQNCLVASATKGDTDLIAVILKAPYRAESGKIGSFEDARELFEWGFSSFRRVEFVNQNDIIAEIKVKAAKDKTFTLAKPDKEFTALLPNDYDKSKITTKVEAVDFLLAPVEKGAKVGTLKLFYDGKEYGKIDLISSDAIERSFLKFALMAIGNFVFSVPFLIVILVIIGLFFVFYLYVVSVNRARTKRRRRRRR